MMSRRAAAAPAAILALATTELRLALRRGESLLVTLLVPAAVLLFFGTVRILPGPADALVPATLAIAIVATGLVSLGIATAYDRHYGVLKRLGGSPLPRWGIPAAKILAVVAIEAVQIALLVGIAAAALGWRPVPSASLPVVLAAVALGTAAFAGLGLILAATLPAETTLAVANALFVALVLAGGLLVPPTSLPDPLGSLAAVLPSGALVEALAAGLGAPSVDPVRPLASLAVWGAALASLAGATFRVE
jgi:ABC-2 type transport system permease protein